MCHASLSLLPPSLRPITMAKVLTFEQEPILLSPRAWPPSQLHGVLLKYTSQPSPDLLGQNLCGWGPKICVLAPSPGDGGTRVGEALPALRVSASYHFGLLTSVSFMCDSPRLCPGLFFSRAISFLSVISATHRWVWLFV